MALLHLQLQSVESAAVLYLLPAVQGEWLESMAALWSAATPIGPAGRLEQRALTAQGWPPVMRVRQEVQTVGPHVLWEVPASPQAGRKLARLVKLLVTMP